MGRRDEVDVRLATLSVKDRKFHCYRVLWISDLPLWWAWVWEPAGEDLPNGQHSKSEYVQLLGVDWRGFQSLWRHVGLL